MERRLVNALRLLVHWIMQSNWIWYHSEQWEIRTAIYAPDDEKTAFVDEMCQLECYFNEITNDSASQVLNSVEW